MNLDNNDIMTIIDDNKYLKACIGTMLTVIFYNKLAKFIMQSNIHVIQQYTLATFNCFQTNDVQQANYKITRIYKLSHGFKFNTIKAE